MALSKGQTVRFTKPSRHGDWVKGDLASVDRILALHPLNQFDLYVVTLSNQQKVWVTSDDIEKHDQLRLFDGV